MGELVRLLSDNLITLIVSLPRNDAQLFETAVKAGADAVLVREVEGLDKILKLSEIPVGFELKEQRDVQQIKQYNKIAFVNFASLYLKKVKDIKIDKVVALSDKYTIDELMSIEKAGVDVVDAAIISHPHWDNNLVIGDLQQYITVCISSGLPVIIPTQRAIKPSEVAIIWDTGIKGIIMTEEVLGMTPKSFEKAVKEFRIAVDDLG